MADIFLTGDQGQSTDQPGAPLVPSIPALDGTQAGLEATVSIMATAVRLLAGQIPRTNNTGGGGVKTQQGKNPQDQKPKPKAPVPRFIEFSRRTEKVTVTDPVSGAFLTYNQITNLVMQDTVTKETWDWKL
jgi:hypothetical protein